MATTYLASPTSSTETLQKPRDLDTVPSSPKTLQNSEKDTDKDTPPSWPKTLLPDNINILRYELQQEKLYLDAIRELISKDLSEPYSIYVYRFFLNKWSQFCWMLTDSDSKKPLIGVIICKLEHHRSGTLRGYIAMLAISSEYRGRGFGSTLARQAIKSLSDAGADEVVLETEEDNLASLRLYSRLNFLKTKHLHRYYLNGKGAFRLVLPLKDPEEVAARIRKDERYGREPDDYDDHQLELYG